mgnify:CR=1 FL=1
MPVRRIDMVQFRNYQGMSCGFAPGMNILYGENGTGKTTILEAIHCLAVTKSFKATYDKHLVRHGEEYYQLSGEFYEGDREDTIQLNYVRNQGKKLLLNGDEQEKLSSIVGRYPVITLTPEDADITFGSPADRRKYVNKILSQSAAGQMKLLQSFGYVLKQRNAVIQRMADDPSDVDETFLSVYDDQFIQTAMEVEKARAEFLKEYRSEVREIYTHLTDGKRELRLRFSPSVPFRDEEQFRESALELFRQRRNQELAFRRTVVGPQSDVIDIYLDGNDVRNFGSQGEHKLILVALKLAEGRYISRRNTGTPIYLMDDLFAELDVERSVRILQYLGDGGQMFITSTDLGDLRQHGIEVEQPGTKILKMEQLLAGGRA